MYPGRLDDKGRLKLPIDFQNVLSNRREKKLFVTSLDRRIAQIYPIEVWRENEIFFKSYRDNPRLARLTLFNANDLGAEVEADSQGRITFPPQLRRALEIEDSPVRLSANKGRIEVLSDKIYQERLQEAQALPGDTIDVLEAAGLV
jgi:DNA-binding transcriptional regulator/RsmH inhibitor MraZ